VNGIGQFAHLPDISLHDVAQRLAVCDADIPPHDRIAGGDAGKILEATRGITEDLVVLLHPGQAVHQTVSQHVGKMGGGCQHLIMMGHRHSGHLGTAKTPHALHLFQSVSRSGFQGGKDDAAVTVQFRKRGPDTAVLGSCNGVARDEPGRQFTPCGLECLDHAVLGTASIRNNGILRQMRTHGRKGPFHRSQRDREKHHVGIADGFTDILGELIDNPQFNRLLQIGQSAPATDDLSNLSGLTQGTGK